jgi:hypothetical protein
VATRALWPPIRSAYRWIHRAAHLLAHPGRRRQRAMRRRFAGLLGAIQRAASKEGPMRQGLQHFVKVTRSFWPGLFHCYDSVLVPRTNNDLERCFGSYRYHERRATGRKAAGAGTVVRGSVRILAATATRLRPVRGPDLAPANLNTWRSVRRALEQRRLVRTLGRRFRHNPRAYLRGLERRLAGKSGLPG